MSLGAGIYALVAWKERFYCIPFILWADDDDDNIWDWDDDDDWQNEDTCWEKTYFIISLLCALLWAASAACLFYFVKSGRHAKCEDKHSGTTTGEGEAAAAAVLVLVEEDEQSVKVESGA